jgi:hypothetical protein
VVYVTNSIDGCYAFLLFRLNGAVSAGAASIVTDVEAAALSSAFDTELSVANKYLRIHGTNEEYTSQSTTTGAFTLDGTASQAYDDNDVGIIVYDLTGRFPKCDKIVAWKDHLHFIGINPNNVNVSTSSREAVIAFTNPFTTAYPEKILQVTGGTSGEELVGKKGKLVNAIATKDYLYLFKQNATYYITVSDVNTATGARPPNLLTEVHGALNQFSVADIGSGEIAYLTSNHRIMRIRVSTDSGAPVVLADEKFDDHISNTVSRMSQDQPGALLYYAGSEKRMYAQIVEDGEPKTQCFSNEIRDWEPPRVNWYFRGYFERKGILYGTDYSDDTVYELNTTGDDNGQDIECIIASPSAEDVESAVTCKFNELEVLGEIAPGSTATVERIVDGGTPHTDTVEADNSSFMFPAAMATVELAGEPMGGADSDDDWGDLS